MHTLGFSLCDLWVQTGALVEVSTCNITDSLQTKAPMFVNMTRNGQSIYVILAYSVIMKKKISFYMLSFNEIPNIFKLNNKITNGTTDNIFKFSYTMFVSVWGVSVAFTLCVLSLLKSCRNAACCSILCTMTSYYILSRKVLFQI